MTIDKDFGGWAKAQAEHFADGGIFDQIYAPSNACLTHHTAASRLQNFAHERDRAAHRARRSKRRARRVIPGFGLTLGFSVAYLSLIVLIPLAGVFLQDRRARARTACGRCGAIRA